MKTGKEFKRLVNSLTKLGTQPIIVQIADEDFCMNNPRELEQLHTLWLTTVKLSLEGWTLRD